MAPMLNFLELWTELDADGRLAPVRATFKGAATLRIAAHVGRKGAATALIASGASRSLRNKNRETAFDIAIASGQTNLAELVK